MEPLDKHVHIGSYHTVIMYHVLFLLFYLNLSLNSVVINKDRINIIYIANEGYKPIVKGCGFSPNGGFPHSYTKNTFRLLFSFHYYG